ncbi:MAG: nitrogenase component 1 [Thermotaleaceae bacterium]
MKDLLYTIPIDRLKDAVSTRQNKVNRRNALHYCAPSGGTWGVVRVACLVPEVIVLFVLPIGCGRHGGIAAFNTEINHKIRYLLVEEVDIVMGTHLDKIQEAIACLVSEEHPKGLILFSTCMDDLLGSDYNSIIQAASAQFKIPIHQGKMNPIMSDTKKPPELMIQKTIYSFLESSSKKSHKINVIGSFSNIDPESEIHTLIKQAGDFNLQHISDCQSFLHFKDMENSILNLLVKPLGMAAVKAMHKMNQQPYVEALSSFTLEEIEKSYTVLSQALECSLDISHYKAYRKAFLEKHRQALQGMRVALGATINARTFELARFLVEQGMQVEYIIAKSLLEADEVHLQWLVEHSPDTKIIPDLDPSLSALSEKLLSVDLCIGLDAAVYFDCTYLIELPFDETLFGFKGAEKLIERIINAVPFQNDLYQRIYNANLVV